MTYIIVLTILMIDQGIKIIIRRNFFLGESMPVIKNIFHLTYVQNIGAGFGILQGQRYFFIIVTILVITALLIYKYKSQTDTILNIALGLIIGGAIANNLIDRIFLGYVVDYLDFRIWPVFNLADTSLVIGVGFLILHLWRTEQQTKPGDFHE